MIYSNSRRIPVKRFFMAMALFLMVFIVACDKSSETPARQGAGANSGTTQPTTATPDLSKALPGTVVNPPAAKSQTPTGYATAPGMNPPHGQPSHRCDIPVGTPLNSPPRTGSTTVPSQPNAPAPTTATATAPGMNPPHGQPNHRCDIAVGAPLNSAPVQPK